jgi:hypothetical protein
MAILKQAMVLVLKDNQALIWSWTSLEDEYSFT